MQIANVSIKSNGIPLLTVQEKFKNRILHNNYECKTRAREKDFLVSGRGLACEQQKTSNLIGF